MTAKLVAQLLADLAITKTHNRPHTSNDNPFNEVAFLGRQERRTPLCLAIAPLMCHQSTFP